MYILEGNVGVGKSTLLEKIQEHVPYLNVITESVSNWSNDDTQESLLARFYADIPRWSYTLETYTLLTRVQEHLKIQQDPNPFKIVERSLYAGNYCFARNGYLQGAMDDIEWSIYNKFFDFLVLGKCKTPTGFIYLQADPEICLARSQKRNRPGEEAIPLEYLQQIHDQHERYLIRKEGVLPELVNVPVLVLDGSADFASDRTILEDHLDKIDEFLFITGDPRGQAKKDVPKHARGCC